MPLTAKGEEIKRAMEKQYGPEKGEEVFYASANKGTITGVHDVVENFEYKQVETGLTLEELQRRNEEYWMQAQQRPLRPQSR